MPRRLGGVGLISCADRRENCGNRRIVGGELPLETRLELIQLVSERSIGDQELAHTDEGPHDLDVDSDRAIATEDRGEHRDALLGEGVGRVAATATL